MRNIRIFTKENLHIGNQICITKPKHHHLAQVLKVQPNQTVTMFDGNGNSAKGLISEISRNNTVIQITETVIAQPPIKPKLEIAVSIVKPDKMDLIVQKATELGANAITPLITEYSSIKVTQDFIEKKQQHWEKIVIASCEQCYRDDLTIVNSPIKLQSWLQNNKKDIQLAAIPGSGDIKNLDITRKQEVSMLFGPEGGFSEEEIIMIKNASSPITLGKNILRTETAVMVGLSYFSIHYWANHE